MKKFLTLVVSLVLVTLIFAGCSKSNKENEENAIKGPSDNFNKEGMPIVDEEINLKFFARRSPVNGPYENMSVFKEFEKMSNIKIDWNDVPQDGFDERKNLEYAAKNPPDVFYKAEISHADAVKYGSSGLFIPLEDLLEEYAPNLAALFEQYPEIKSAITAPDGHIYALPAIVELDAARTEKFWLNKDWLDELGLEEPTTPDELVEVLTAFKNDDPNGNGKQDEIPLTERNFPTLINNFASSWGLLQQLGNTLNVENDKVHIWKTDDRYKDLLQFLNKLYSEGLLDRDVLSHTPSEYTAKLSTGKVGMTHTQGDDMSTQYEDYEYMGISPIEGPFGDRLVKASPIARDFGTFAITSANEYPVETIRWIDYFFSEEGSIMFRYGIEGDTFNYDDDGLPQYIDEDASLEAVTPFPGGGAPQYITEYNSSAINSEAVQEAQKKFDPYLPEVIYGPPLFDEQLTKEVNQIRQDMDAYYNETSSQFINGDLSFDKWDEYVFTIENMGLERLEEIYQEAYDSTFKE
ncbi:sugar ABC transporter substrate-binding protein [Bacillus sp. J14TS2]|uniref:extracellular solute-binding protein n=1 Tax=Bacillus sp. J14TS2 TaxID=2807188 RepID=UPI001B068C66|nr:extracellular solute-binding protein [Bacillus sp. J14TS2]GIN72256.1 sugar ABC transporter substrate-binding protein [Bacillus sp. J14TS2]